MSLIEHSEHDEEFQPLPFYPWDERPSHVPLDHDEAATAIHLGNGDLARAAELLRTPVFRVNRLVRHSPRLQRIQNEALELTLIAAVSVPIQALFDPTADRRAREWASTKVLQSRLAAGHPLSPAPPIPSATQASLTVNAPQKTLTFRWRTDADDIIPTEPAAIEPGGD